jgi:hypothetical protein
VRGRNDHTNGDDKTQQHKGNNTSTHKQEHPIRPFCTNSSKIDEYALRPKIPILLFILAAEHLGTLQIDMRKIEITPQYNRPPWPTIDHQQHDFELCAIVRGSKKQRLRVEKYRILKEN